MFLAAIPGSDILPAPLWLVTTLHVLTLALHLVAMNFLFGGLVVVALGRVPDRATNPTVRRLLGLFPTLMAATVTLGVAPLLFTQLVYGRVVYSAAIVSAWWWIAVPLVVTVAYYCLYGAAFAKQNPARAASLAKIALLGLCFVAFVFTSVFSLAERPALQRELYAANQSGSALNPVIGAWGFRLLHMLTGAIAVGAWFVGFFGRRDAHLSLVARRFFVGGMLAAMAVGLAYLGTLGDALGPFMKSSGIHVLAAGIVLSVASLLVYLRRRLVLSGVLLFASVLAMVGSRHVLRNVVLSDRFDPSTLPVDPQWELFVLFAACLVIALGVIAWMLRVFARAAPEASS